MSELVKVTIIPENDPIVINLTEPSVIKVGLYPVTIAHPSILEAANAAESSAGNASASAQQASDAAAAAQAAVDGIGPTVDAAVDEALATETRSLINALIFG